MSLKFHEGLEDMNSGDFNWDTDLDFRFWLPDSTLYGDGTRAAADVWNTILGATPLILQDVTHMSPKIPSATRDTDDEGLIQLNASFSFTPTSEANVVLLMFGKSTGAGLGDKIGYFYYDNNDDVDNILPFLAQGNLVTIATPNGLYQF